MQLQFDGILARVRMRSTHWDNDPVVQDFSGGRFQDAPQIGCAIHKRRLALRQPGCNRPGVRAAESDNANAADATSGGKAEWWKCAACAAPVTS